MGLLSSAQCLISTRLLTVCRKLKDKLKKGRRTFPEESCTQSSTLEIPFAHFPMTGHTFAFVITASEQPRRESDLRTPAKHLALACVCATSWLTLRSSPQGMKEDMLHKRPLCKTDSCHFFPLTDSETSSVSTSPCIQP